MSYAFSDRIANMTGNAIREIFKLLDQGDITSFAGGMPSNEMLPVDLVSELSQKVLADNGKGILQYGATDGYSPLRESTAELLKTVGINCTPQDVTILSGAQQGIDLACKAFLNKGDRVLVENPTYLAALQIMRTYEAEIIGIDTDDEGMTPEDMEKAIIEHQPKLIYLIPTFQNPSGRTLSVERRKRLVEVATKHNVVIIEDDPYRELRYTGEPLPSMKSFDEKGIVIYLTSFSKTISPGLRVGAAVAAPDVLRKMTIGKQATDVHTSLLSQAVVDRYLREGHFYPQLQKVIPVYRERMDCMLNMIKQHFPSEVKYTIPQGGLFIWAELPGDVDAKAVLEKCIERKVAYIPGTHFYANGAGKNTLRLNFSNENLDRIENGIKVMAEVFKTQL